MIMSKIMISSNIVWPEYKKYFGIFKRIFKYELIINN